MLRGTRTSCTSQMALGTFPETQFCREQNWTLERVLRRRPKGEDQGGSESKVPRLPNARPERACELPRPEGWGIHNETWKGSMGKEVPDATGAPV